MHIDNDQPRDPRFEGDDREATATDETEVTAAEQSVDDQASTDTVAEADEVQESAEGQETSEGAQGDTESAAEPIESHAESAQSAESSAEPAEEAADALPRRVRTGWNTWRHEIATIGGRSSLLRFVDTTATRIELSTTHPGGLAQFIIGKPTLLSNLIRDDLALRAARGAAAAILSKGVELAAARSIDAVHLAVGIAQVPGEPHDIDAPVLLRPLVIRRRGRDFELQLRGRAYVNPELARVLRDDHGIELDEQELVSLADDRGAFSPNPVLDRLREYAVHVPGFSVEPRVLVSIFADVATAMSNDLAIESHPVLDAVAGEEIATSRLRQLRAEPDFVPQDERSPETDRLVLDADSELEKVVAEALAGNSVTVNARPGTGSTQTIVNLIGALVGDDRRVLVVSPRRATTAAIVDRLSEAGLPGLAVSESNLRRDLISSIGRSEKAKEPDVADIDDALVRLRKVLGDYRAALRRVDPELQVSVVDCLSELSKLAMLPVPPQTQARLSRESIAQLADKRQHAAQTMAEAASLGEFQYSKSDTPWYGANFDSDGDADLAFEDAQTLAGGELDELLEQAEEVLGATKIQQFETFEQLTDQIDLLIEIRESLEVFHPSIYDRPIGELVTATGSRRDANAALGGMQRRRLKKHALEYVRPGARITDLHNALVRVQRQRKRWNTLTPDGAVPAIPSGLRALEELHARVLGRLERIGDALKSDYRDAITMDLDALREWIDSLAANSDALTNIRERSRLIASLEELELDPLFRDLADRKVPVEQVECELELAWWQSALETLIGSQRALLRGNTQVLSRLETDFALVDETHAAASSGRLAWQLAEQWRLGIRDWPDEAKALRTIIKSGSVDSASLAATAPHLLRPLAPVWLASPYNVHEVSHDVPFDCVIIADAGSVTIAEVAGAIARAPQVVAIGDAVTQAPSAFAIGISAMGVRKDPGMPEPGELGDESALSRLMELLPTLELSRTFRTGGHDLLGLINERFYDGAIESLPWAGTYLGHPSVSVETVEDAWGLPKPGAAEIESPDAEIDKVLSLVAQHARTRPNESLMVVTGNERHEARLQQALVQQLGQNPSIADFISTETDEPFVIADLTHAMALSRDRVIFSVGYGRSKYSKNVDFGPLGKEGGEQLLAIALTRARRALTIVASFDAAELDPDSVEHGAAQLREILLDVATPQLAIEPGESDPLMTDLADRLRVFGLDVTLNYRGLPLVVANGGVCAAVLSDHEQSDDSLRHKLRIEPEMLRRLGWHTMRVHAFELFTDPEAVAARVAEMVGVDAQ
ncbi:AAA family ATPase [uncultured Agrococcus sp.]|uniref:DEAD/DEAH box helicase n=1 Tax=uncultured Agrococcus sp. TaxID=382258 RepID=UPI0025F8E644|nr:AAA family ATPase [uncultured Agrococcus sp.]